MITMRMIRLYSTILSFLLISSFGCEVLENDESKEIRSYLNQFPITDTLDNILIIRVSGCEPCLESSAEFIKQLTEKRRCNINTILVGDTTNNIVLNPLNSKNLEIIQIDINSLIDFTDIEFSNLALITKKKSGYRIINWDKVDILEDLDCPN